MTRGRADPPSIRTLAVSGPVGRDDRSRLLLRVCLGRTSVVRARKTSHENPLDNRARVRRARDATIGSAAERADVGPMLSDMDRYGN